MIIPMQQYTLRLTKIFPHFGGYNYVKRLPISNFFFTAEKVWNLSYKIL